MFSGIRKMRESDLATVLTWRNHVDVRRFMVSQHEISMDEHTAWFERASKDPRRHLMIYETGNGPLGYVAIQLLDDGRVADWGFYIAPGAPKGTGAALGKAALDYGFRELGLHKVCGQVLGFNERSARFHQKLGFEQEGVLRDQHFDGAGYHSVICYGLLAEEWESHRQQL
jgi:UDP-4-amino-4,6-dideoxy-N-acetyl-beta-L-altrosamine N-acetyltransferase